MDTYISNMQDTIKRYAQILSEVVKVDVEIVDAKLNRIAGTGEFRGKVNMNASEEGHIYKQVIESKERNINSNPSRQSICIGCPSIKTCKQKYGISTPILLNQKVIGIIGFVAFTDQQKKHIEDNLTTFLNLSEQISELIALKAKEEIERKEIMDIMKILNKTIDKMEEGVVVIDENDKIVKINYLGRKILKIEDGENMEISLNKTGNTILEKGEYIAKVGGESFTISGEEYRIHLSDLKYHKIFIFNNVDYLKEKIVNITYSQENIDLDKILGNSQKILSIKEKVRIVAPSTSTVLITGESGTGKEMLARALHSESDRKNRPFVAINCASIPDALLESELFGYEKGAFTGADSKGKTGKIEFANRGTLFLDEIGDMPLYLQAKLLRVLQDRKIVKVGSNQEISVDIRIIAATNKNLEKMIREKTFREDLYYRLNVIPVNIPSLRERKEDIEVLTDFFIKKYVKELNKRISYIDPSIRHYLFRYDWPGNIRELENTVEYMVNMTNDGIVDFKKLPNKIVKIQATGSQEEFNLEKIERETIERAIEKFGKNLEAKKQVAGQLGIGIATLYRKLEKYKI